MCLRDAEMDSLASLLIYLLFMWHCRLSLCFHPLSFGCNEIWEENVYCFLSLPFINSLLVDIDFRELQNNIKDIHV